MLVQMLPEQVSENWGAFRYFIGMSLPPNVSVTEEGMANVLRAVLIEQLVVWTYYGENGRSKFVMTTKIDKDYISNQKKLVIYSFTGIDNITHEMIKSGQKTISEYARKKGCQYIEAYSKDQSLLKMVQALGYDISFNILTKEV